MKDLILFGLTTIASVLLSKLTSKQDFTDVTPSDEALRKALEEGITRDAAELVCSVDENNNPIPEGHTRAEMRLNNLWHRATYIVVLLSGPDNIGKSSHQVDDDDLMMLVQKRSDIKDYCPGKLDPTPGGVVGYGESYRENAEREIQEEMGIDVSTQNSPNKLKRLFTFPYQDANVKCWGDLYEATFTGSMDDLKIQNEEVADVLLVSLSDVCNMMKKASDAWMPDSLHAMQLYLQYREDRRANRKFLKGYSSGDIDKYNLRPKPQVIFFDCDDCLYFDGWKVANMLTKKIDDYCVRIGLPEGEAYMLYKKYGTALKGLLAEGHIDGTEEAIDAFLKDVHDIPVASCLKRDEKLRELLLNIDPTIQKYVFTASVGHHAERCLKALGVDDLFIDIIDVKKCDLETKHSQHAFGCAMRIAGVDHPESCVFLDDNTKNIHAAREFGWRSILVGKIGRDSGKPISSDNAEAEINHIHDISLVLPEIFVQQS